LLNLNGFTINCCWWCCENMLLVNWSNDYALRWIDDDSCCCCWIIMEVWWIIEFLTKWCFDLEFWVSFGMCSCIWPINIIWNVFWVWEDQKWSVWEKGFWNSNFSFWTHECSLKRALSEAQASVPRSLLDTVRLSELWASGERTRMLLMSRVRLSERQANPKRTSPECYWDLVT